MYYTNTLAASVSAPDKESFTVEGRHSWRLISALMEPSNNHPCPQSQLGIVIFVAMFLLEVMINTIHLFLLLLSLGWDRMVLFPFACTSFRRFTTELPGISPQRNLPTLLVALIHSNEVFLEAKPSFFTLPTFKVPYIEVDDCRDLISPLGEPWWRWLNQTCHQNGAAAS